MPIAKNIIEPCTPPSDNLKFKLSLFFLFFVFILTCCLMLSNQMTFKRVFKLQNNTTKYFKMVEILDKS